MNKFKKLSFIIILLLIPLTFVSCLKKTAITSVDFTTEAKANDFTVTDITDTANNPAILEAYSASDNENYQIEFYVLSDETTSKDIFLINKTKLEDDAEEFNSISKGELNILNYNKYNLSSETNYSTIIRVDNTFIFCSADVKYKDDIKNFISDLGY